MAKGTITVRMPEDVYKEVFETAHGCQVSMNRFCLLAIINEIYAQYERIGDDPRLASLEPYAHPTKDKSIPKVIVVRMPPRLHPRLIEMAHLCQVSMNSFCLVALRNEVKMRRELLEAARG